MTEPREHFWALLDVVFQFFDAHLHAAETGTVVPVHAEYAPSKGALESAPPTSAPASDGVDGPAMLVDGIPANGTEAPLAPVSDAAPVAASATNPGLVPRSEFVPKSDT